MFDFHTVPVSDWGVLPVLFKVGDIPISSYSFFMLLAIVLGSLVYWLEARKQKMANENSFYIIIAALIGGAIGAKLLIVIYYWNQIVASFPDLTILLSGRSILGGLVGGFLGVLLVKKKLKIQGRRGNLFVPAIALGVAIGRIGCFLAGCCFGDPTSLPWGVDFGDGILRHPTQLYESLFMLGVFFYSKWKLKDKKLKPGQLFNQFIIIYFVWRFLVSFIRAEPSVLFGLDFFQWFSLGAIILFWIRGRKFRKQNK